MLTFIIMKTGLLTLLKTYLFLTLLFGSNSYGLHALSHTEENTNTVDCEFCSFLVQNDSNDIVFLTPHTDALLPHSYPNTIIRCEYSPLYIEDCTPLSFVTRPPPRL